MSGIGPVLQVQATDTAKPVSPGPQPALTAADATSPACAEDTFKAVLDRARTLAGQGKRPIVVFDLDDTLFRTAPRTAKILREFAQSMPDRPYAAALSQVSADQCGYSLDPVLKAFAVPESDWPAAKQFWGQRFFSSDYVTADQPNPGAVAFVAAVQKTGAQVVYLTGRSEQMGPGTQQALQAAGFPWDPQASTALLLKADPSLKDVPYKVGDFNVLKAMGTVVATVDNEPGNVNAMHSVVPGAITIYLDKPHSPTAPPVDAGIYQAADFPVHGAIAAGAAPVTDTSARGGILIHTP